MVNNDEDYMRIARFEIDYLFYLQECLLDQSLTTYDIAFYGGVCTLCFLSHLPVVQEFAKSILQKVEDNYLFHRNELFVSFCFLNALKFYSPFGKKLELFNSPSFKILDMIVYIFQPNHPFKNQK